MNQKLVSIIIVTYNSEHDIYDCVQSIKDFADVPLSAIELVVVDNCSRDPEPMFVRLQQMWGDDIRLIRNTENGGYGQGNNIGLRNTTAPLSMIMNPDVRLMMPVFKRTLDRFKADAKLAVLGMKQMTSATTVSGNSFCPDWLMNGYLRPIVCAVTNRFNWFFPSRMYVQGSCFFVRKSMFEAVGMFDEGHFMYGEEEDIHYRLLARFGASCYGFDKCLRYIHKTAGRIPSFAYEKRIVDANLALYKKKGIDGRRIVLHFMQNLRVVMLRDRIFGVKKEQKIVNEQLMDYLKSLKK